MDPLARRVASVATRAPRTIRHAASRARRGARALPTRVRAGGRRPPDGAAGRVAADGTVALPAPLRARTVRIEILDAAFPRGTPGIDTAAPRRRRSGSVTRAGRPARRCRRGGVAAPAAAATGRRCASARARCASAWPRHRARLDAGRPLRAVACGAPSRSPPAPATVRAAATRGASTCVRLASPAPASRRAPAPGRVLDPGRDGRGARDGVRRRRRRRRAGSCSPSPTTRGWRARCDGRDLGRAGPDARLRQRLAGAARLSQRVLRLRAQSRAARQRRRSRSLACLLLLALLRPAPAPRSAALAWRRCRRSGGAPGRYAARSLRASPRRSCWASCSPCAPARSSGPCLPHPVAGAVGPAARAGRPRLLLGRPSRSSTWRSPASNRATTRPTPRPDRRALDRRRRDLGAGRWPCGGR